MTEGAPDDVIGADEAAAVLEVPLAQVAVLAEQGVITPVQDGAGGWGYLRAEVVAARELGG